LPTRPRRTPRATTLLVVPLLLVAACAGGTSNVDPEQVDAVEAPELGACRVLTPEDVASPSNASLVIDCTDEHTAETFAVGPLPARFEDAAHDDERLGRFAYRRCSEAFQNFLGADESLVMRTLVSWAWFRPSEQAWADGARWYRCDVVGGGEQSSEYVALPTTARGLLLGRPDDHWMVCAQGPELADAVKVPCSAPHGWRAVTTIKVGQDSEAYPGDRLVEVKSRDFCSDSVRAWLKYPAAGYDFAYTWFGKAEWEAGNRRSVCWARTNE